MLLKLIKRKYKRLFLLLALLTVINACQRKELPQEPAPIVGKFTSFKIRAEKNGSITSKDILGNIDSNKIILTIPSVIQLESVYISYAFIGTKLFHKNVEVDSTSSLKLSNKDTFRIQTNKGRHYDFVLIIQQFDDSGLKMEQFSIQKQNNTNLPKNINFEIKEDSIIGTLNSNQYLLVPFFTTNADNVQMDGISQTNGISVINFKTAKTYTLQSASGFQKKYFIKINWLNNIAHLYITTDGNAGITSKDNYVHANIRIDGNGIYENYSGSTQIKGRGNTTWGYPKKPYRLKLDTKASLLGLSAEKDWVLLANYLDGTSLTNVVAMEAGKLLGMPYTNNMIPVEVSVNNVYNGLYLFTEQVEVESNRINIGKDSILFEMDSYYDEDWKFKSPSYQLPVMIKSPSLTSTSDLTPIQTQFNQLESLISSTSFPNNNYLASFDENAFANFIIVFLLADNEEINHPKSVYLTKSNNGKYTMGPVWDFDWAYGYETSGKYFEQYNTPLFWTGNKSKPGSKFFSRIASDPYIKNLIKQKWANFKSNKLSEILSFIDDYATVIKDARSRDYQKWARGNADFTLYISTLKTWLQKRADYIDTYIDTF